MELSDLPKVQRDVFAGVWFAPEDEDAWEDWDSYSMGSYLRGGAREEPATWEGQTVDAPDAYVVPVTTWGDYVGSCVERSNYRSLLRDFPDAFRSVDGGYNSHYLIVRESDLTKDDGHLADILIGLAHDYPLYDEQDHSALELELEQDCWDSYIAHDVVRTADNFVNAATDNHLDLADIAPYYEDASLDGNLRARFLELMELSGTYPECEDAVSAYWRGLDDVAEQIAAEALGAWVEGYAADLAAWRAAPTAGIAPLFDTADASVRAS